MLERPPTAPTCYDPSVANPRHSVAENVDGDFFVDSSCIDCETCRWVAPATFGSAEDHAFVAAQPKGPDEERRALLALIACPTASIGARGEHDVKAAQQGFPDPVARNVYHLGYHAESSFGAASYLVRSAGGSVMVDSPRFSRPLVNQLEEMGGVDMIFLTHRDDLADFEKFRDHFGTKVIIHRRDQSRRTAKADIVLEGELPTGLGAGLLAIPVPGHTAGSTCLLFEDEVLFSGDHLAFDPKRDRLHAFRSACWFDWREQTRSMERLRHHAFTHVLPGHGHPVRLEGPQMRAALERCIAWMHTR